MFLCAGVKAARTVGLLSGNRQPALIWAALGTTLADHHLVELYFSMSMIAISILPMASKVFEGAIPLFLQRRCDPEKWGTL